MSASLNRVTWKDDIQRALAEIGRDASTTEIYRRVAEIRRREGRSVTTHSRAGVARILERYSVERYQDADSGDAFIKVCSENRAHLHWRLK